ncbi:four helix bundle protein [Flavobacteriaceae bacterium MAR_2010_188]|nr:four helix bundle protein [Flavobacteriaceae bacterium MAR_2010_188]
MENQTYRKLIVWQKSMLLVTKVYQSINDFPKDELYGLSSQVKRSSISIPSNIAEGYGRDGKKEFLRFLNISMSSLFELKTQLEIAMNLKFLNDNVFNEIYADSREIERMLSSLINTLKNN